MTVIAFTYDNFERSGIRNSFRGQYRDSDEARERILGGRFGYLSNLEIMDLDTLGWEYYYWLPLYEYTSRWVQGEDKEMKEVQTLKHRWDKNEPIITLEWDGHVRRYGKHNPIFDAGEWSHKTGGWNG